MGGSVIQMTEKRYILSHNGKEDGIRDKTNDKGYYGFELARLVNDLSEENKQLKQFKENVIKWVDSQMKFNGKKYIETEDYHFKSENVDLHNFKVFIGID